MSYQGRMALQKWSHFGINIVYKIFIEIENCLVESWNIGWSNEIKLSIIGNAQLNTCFDEQFGPSLPYGKRKYNMLDKEVIYALI